MRSHEADWDLTRSAPFLLNRTLNANTEVKVKCFLYDLVCFNCLNVKVIKKKCGMNAYYCRNCRNLSTQRLPDVFACRKTNPSAAAWIYEVEWTLQVLESPIGVLNMIFKVLKCNQFNI